jgi:hypothetical protein
LPHQPSPTSAALITTFSSFSNAGPYSNRQAQLVYSAHDRE